MTTSRPSTIATAVEQMVRQISRVPDAETDLTHHLELHDAGYLDPGYSWIMKRTSSTCGVGT